MLLFAWTSLAIALRFANNFFLFFTMKKLLSLLSSACAANCSFTTILTEKPSSDLSLNPVKIICSFLFLFGFQWTSFSQPLGCFGGLKLLESLSAFLLIRCINIRIASLRCFRLATSRLLWWAQVDSNHRPHAYQACALTCWAMSP